MQQVFLVILINLTILFDLSPLLPAGAVVHNYLFDSISLVHFIQLSSVVPYVFEIQPCIQYYTHDAYHGPEERSPKVPMLCLLSVIDYCTNDTWGDCHPSVLYGSAEAECRPYSLGIDHVGDRAPEGRCIDSVAQTYKNQWAHF